MLPIDNDQYFLLIPDINLYPTIKPNSVAMLEQCMNALLLTNKYNVQHGINAVITLESYSKPIVNHDYLTVLQNIKPLLEKSNIHVVQGEQVRAAYPKYHNKHKYYWDVGKQSSIDIEFALEKKLSFDGEAITFENTYIDWVNQIVTKSRETSTYNTLDELLYRQIEPKTLNQLVETREIILEETQKYAENYRKKLQLQRVDE